MKYLSLIAIILISSCTKSGYKPDWDQVACVNVNYIEEQWTDSVNGKMLDSAKVVWPAADQSPLVCSQIEINKAEKFARDTTWERLCDADGTKYFIKMYAIIY